MAMVMGAFGGSVTSSFTSTFRNLSILAQNAFNAGYGCGTYGQFVASTTTAGSSPNYSGACTQAVTVSSSSSSSLSSSSISSILSSSISSSFSSFSSVISVSSSRSSSSNTAQTTPSISIKAILSGAYDNTTKLMRTTLRSNNLIPAAASFPSSFGYTGSDSSNNISSTVVDWVMIEVRNSTGTNVLMRKAALLNNDGNILDSVTGIANIPLTGLSAGSYKVIIRHRNHLAISTQTPVAIISGNNSLINFTANSANSQLNAGTNASGSIVYGMRNSNVNSNSIINVLDAGESANAADSTLYNVFDVNLDGITNVIDTGLVRNAPDAVESL
jgi:hypothetical protein